MAKLERLEPAATVIAKCGGVEAVVAITGKHLSRVYRWMYPKANGGTDGAIPQADAEKLLEHAVAAGIDLTPADFFLTRAPTPPAEGVAA